VPTSPRPDKRCLGCLFGSVGRGGSGSVKELATRRPDNLHAKIDETNSRKQLTQRPPAVGLVEDWIDQAETLPKVLRY